MGFRKLGLLIAFRLFVFVKFFVKINGLMFDDGKPTFASEIA